MAPFWLGLVSKEVFPWLGCDNSGPAVDFPLFEEIISVLAGLFDLVEICLGDGEGFRGVFHLGL